MKNPVGALVCGAAVDPVVEFILKFCFVAAIPVVSIAAPVVKPASTNFNPIPDVNEADVTNASTADSAAVAAKSRSTPVVVPVSAPVDEILTRDEPAPRTDVVCETSSPVPAPSVRAFVVIFKAFPAVVLTAVIPITLPVEEFPENPPVKAAILPV